MNTVMLPQPAKDVNDARRIYAEQYGSAIVTNMYLRVALLFVCAGLAFALWAILSLSKQLSHRERYIVRISDIGRAEAVRYDGQQYQPQEGEIKYFLTQFVHDYYTRSRATVRTDFPRAMNFLDAPLAYARMDKAKKSKEIESFLTGSENEIEIDVDNIVVQDLRKPPYRAMVDYEKRYLNGHDRVETRREKCVGTFVFTFREDVPNSAVPVNPLGLTITYFREDQAFGEGAGE